MDSNFIFSCINIFISTGTLIVALLTLRRTKDIKAQYEANTTTTELNKREIERQNLEHPARIKIDYDLKSQVLSLMNVGGIDAIDVIVELKDKIEMVDLEDRFPVTIESGDIFEVPMHVWMDCPDFVDVNISWKDEDGLSHVCEKKIYLT